MLIEDSSSSSESGSGSNNNAGMGNEEGISVEMVDEDIFLVTNHNDLKF